MPQFLEQLDCLLRGQNRRRFIQNQDLRSAHERLEDLDLLLHADRDVHDATGGAALVTLADRVDLAKEHGMDLKQIAMFAWLPFLAADLGSVASGYLTRLYTRLFGCSRVNSVVASSVTGAFLMISLAIVAITRDPYITIVLISIGGFGHQIISCMLSALVVESFDKGQMATVNGMRGSAAWIASFLFSLLIGVTADKIGFNPLFIAMGFFDLIGAFFLVTFIAERRAKRA